MIITAIYAVLFYIATIILVVGVVRKIMLYARVPNPLVIPTTPAPITRGGVILRMAREVTVFESLFKSNKWTWILGILFHWGMLIALIGHIRFLTDPTWDWVTMIQWVAKYGGIAMALGLLGLFIRRLAVERVRYISSPSDYLIVALLFMIAFSGLMMRYVAHTDIIAVKAFLRGVMTFNWQPLPLDVPIMVHLGLVIILMIIFPISKMMHAPGVFFSPTRTMVDNPREKRHVAAWAEDRNRP
ncbi:MAG: respiratory nitrate reductase subunit gamma [Arenicellales bacterium]